MRQSGTHVVFRPARHNEISVVFQRSDVRGGRTRG